MRIDDLEMKINNILRHLEFCGIEDYSIILACREAFGNEQNHLWHMTPIYTVSQFNLDVMRQYIAQVANHMKVIEHHVSDPYIVKKFSISTITVGLSRKDALKLQRSYPALNSFFGGPPYLTIGDVDVQWLYLYL